MLAGLDVAGADDSIKSTIADIKTQAADYGTLYGDLEKESVAAARGDVAAKRDLTGTLMEGAEADIEGVRGRSRADIAGAFEGARGAQAREMQSYGVDPSSGKFGAMTRKSFMDEARSGVIAGNLAARGEKERAAGAAERAFSLIDPSKAAGIASDISTKKAGYTRMTADLAKTESERKMGITKAKTDITGAIGKVGEQYGSIGATMLGIETAQRGAGTQSMDPSSTMGAIRRSVAA
jgi:hypothetical protein